MRRAKSLPSAFAASQRPEHSRKMREHRCLSHCYQNSLLSAEKLSNIVTPPDTQVMTSDEMQAASCMLGLIIHARQLTTQHLRIEPIFTWVGSLHFALAVGYIADERVFVELCHQNLTMCMPLTCRCLQQRHDSARPILLIVGSDQNYKQHFRAENGQSSYH